MILGMSFVRSVYVVCFSLGKVRGMYCSGVFLGGVSGF